MWLLQHGADPSRKDRKGWTAYDYAAHSYGNGQGKGRTLLERIERSAARDRAREYFAGLVRQYATKR